MTPAQWFELFELFELALVLLAAVAAVWAKRSTTTTRRTLDEARVVIDEIATSIRPPPPSAAMRRHIVEPAPSWNPPAAGYHVAGDDGADLPSVGDLELRDWGGPPHDDDDAADATDPGGVFPSDPAGGRRST